jgi:hypothetical protein
MCQTKTIAHPAHHNNIKGAAAEVEGEAAEAEVAAGAEDIKRKESGIAFLTKIMMTTVPITTLIRKDSRPS